MGHITKTAVITGASSGIGLAAAHAMLGQGWRVIGVGRNAERTERAAADLRTAFPDGDVTFLRADLSLIKEADRLADDILAVTNHIDVLANNAGGMADATRITAEGLEENFAGNHLGPFHLTQRLIPCLRATAAGQAAGSVRVINTSSDGSEMIPTIDPDAMESMHDWAFGALYCTGKLANVLHAKSLARMLAKDGITVHSFHPGTVDSNFFAHTTKDVQSRYLGVTKLSMEDGADTLIWLATNAAGAGNSGGYWHKRELREPNPVALDNGLADRLWDASAALAAKILAAR
jgi:NAD(P)-dependent dehydrogenase (short-subunit alcohol dehydrogenase family)